MSVLLLACLACGAEDPAAPASPPVAPPPGAVLLVDALPLAAGDVAQLTADIELLYPGYAHVHALRLALTNDALPRLAVRAQDPGAWQRARAECEQAGSALERAVPTPLEGRFRGLGLSLWSAARHLAPGEWSGPIELPGRWVRLRVDERSGTERPREEFLRVSMLEFPFVAGQAAVEEAIDRSRLTVIDPAFDEAVPEAWKHRMRGAKP